MEPGRTLGLNTAQGPESRSNRRLLPPLKVRLISCHSLIQSGKRHCSFSQKASGDLHPSSLESSRLSPSMSRVAIFHSQMVIYSISIPRQRSIPLIVKMHVQIWVQFSQIFIRHLLLSWLFIVLNKV